MSVGFNPATGSSNIYYRVNQASRDAVLSQQKISSGLQINSAKDNAAGLSIATRLTSDINGLTQARRNAGDAAPFLQTGDGALASITDNIGRIRELSVQAGNGILNADDRLAIQYEINSLTEEIFRISDNTTFNGISTLNNDSDLSFQIGNAARQTISSSASKLSEKLAGLRLADIDVSTAESTTAALDTLDSVLNSVSAKRSEFGSLQNRLDSISSNLETQSINSTATRSQILDTDIAMEAAKLVNAQIRQQVGIAIQAQANGSADAVLRLLE